MPVICPVLSSLRDWDEWYAHARATALDLDIWEYVDPTKTTPQPPTKPKEPTPAEYFTGNRNILNPQFRQMGKNDKLAYQQALDDYRWAYKVYGKVHRSMVEFRKFLVETVDPVYLDGYLDETLKQTVKRLEKLLRPSSGYRSRMNALSFEKVNQGPGAEGVAKWTAAWLAEAEKAVQRGCISGTDAKNHFLQHLFVLDREWFERSKNVHEASSATYEDLAIKFHRHVGEQTDLGATPQSARREENYEEEIYIELNETPVSETKSSASTPDLQPEIVPRSCQMGDTNADTAMPDLISEQTARCLPTNSRHPQPVGDLIDFSEDSGIDDEEDEVTDEEVDDVGTVIEVDPRDENDGGDKCLCGEKHQYWECKYLNPQARWRSRWVRHKSVNKQVQAAMNDPLTWARVKDSIHQRNAAEIGELMRCTPPPQTGDLPKNVIISNGCTLNGQQINYATFWVVSPLNDFHICNDRHRFLELDATVDHITYDGTRMEVLGYGKAWLHVQRNTYDFKKIVLTHVAYIPRFPTSVIALRRLEGLKMSHRHPQILSENGQLFANLKKLRHKTLLVADYCPIPGPIMNAMKGRPMSEMMDIWLGRCMNSVSRIDPGTAKALNPSVEPSLEQPISQPGKRTYHELADSEAPQPSDSTNVRSADPVNTISTGSSKKRHRHQDRDSNHPPRRPRTAATAPEWRRSASPTRLNSDSYHGRRWRV